MIVRYSTLTSINIVGCCELGVTDGWDLNIVPFINVVSSIHILT